VISLKGTPIINTLKVLKEMGGDPLIESIKTSIPTEHRINLFDKPILPISYVSYDSYLTLVETAAKCQKKDISLFFEELNNVITAHEFNGILKIFIKILSPHTLLAKSASIWKQYFNQGLVTSNSLGDTKHELIISGITTMPKYHDIDFTTTLKAMFVYCNAKNVKINHTECVSKGGTNCVYTIEWSK
jgi:hypothetical protein